ncbi:hypothetical protein [Streptomyces sp. UH6]|uniref:hypothetical protein n=1 Tax=Streptomyces sp. UH6 TaxID=2748379 RepID=UPI0015D4E700|nr:hypothetical protein [Streptomyces sp. UH6]NYV73109.1 hypothetical protein [Streptomyces sp. UH6]
MKVSLCKHSYPVQPPRGSMLHPGDCTGCGITWNQRQAELRKQDEALIVGSSRDGKCPDCSHTRRLFRFQPPAQPWHEPDYEPPVTFLCMGCWDKAAEAHDEKVKALYTELAA